MDIEKYVPRNKLKKLSHKIPDKKLGIIIKMAMIVGNILGTSTTREIHRSSLLWKLKDELHDQHPE